MLHRISARALSFGLVLAMSLATQACMAPADDDDPAAASASAQTENPFFDAVIADGTKIETDATRTARQSASTRLVGYVPGGDATALLTKLLSVARWTEIKDREGEKPFTRAEVASDTVDEETETRTVISKLTMSGRVTLDVTATAAPADEGFTVTFTNTSTYKHWLAGTILDPGKLVIDVKLVPYKRGVIIDATMRAKMRKMEDKAPELTAAIASIFEWLAAGR
jgi:hypothetical protein